MLKEFWGSESEDQSAYCNGLRIQPRFFLPVSIPRRATVRQSQPRSVLHVGQLFADGLQSLALDSFYEVLAGGNVVNETDAKPCGPNAVFWVTCAGKWVSDITDHSLLQKA